MEIIFELLFGAIWLVAEVLLNVFFEALVELGAHSLKAPFQNREPVHPAFVAIGYSMLGAIAGGLSLLVFSHGFITGETWRMVNLVVTPVLSGAVMVLMGRWRKRRGDLLVRLDRFGYGYIFALAFGAVRFAFTA